MCSEGARCTKPPQSSPTASGAERVWELNVWNAPSPSSGPSPLTRSSGLILAAAGNGRAALVSHGAALIKGSRAERRLRLRVAVDPTARARWSEGIYLRVN